MDSSRVVIDSELRRRANPGARPTIAADRSE
jgi:hypothetical protein